MKLINCHNSNPIDSLFEQMNFPVFGRFLNETTEGGQGTALRTPRTNITEVDGAYHLSLEMPGVKKNEVEITIEGNSLVIKGSRTVESETKQDVVRREFHTSSFERSFSIGDGVDRDAVKATMEDGVLTITLSKTKDKVGRKISVA